MPSCRRGTHWSALWGLGSAEGSCRPGIPTSGHVIGWPRESGGSRRLGATLKFEDRPLLPATPRTPCHSVFADLRVGEIRTPLLEHRQLVFPSPARAKDALPSRGGPRPMASLSLTGWEAAAEEHHAPGCLRFSAGASSPNNVGTRGGSLVLQAEQLPADWSRSESAPNYWGWPDALRSGQVVSSTRTARCPPAFDDPCEAASQRRQLAAER